VKLLQIAPWALVNSSWKARYLKANLLLKVSEYAVDFRLLC